MTSKSSSSLKILWLYIRSLSWKGYCWVNSCFDSRKLREVSAAHATREVRCWKNTLLQVNPSLSFIFQTHITLSNAQVLTLCMWFKGLEISFQWNPSLAVPQCLQFLFFDTLQGKLCDASVEIITWQEHMTCQPWTPQANLNIICNLHSLIILFPFATIIYWVPTH